MAAFTKTKICNLALSHLGSSKTIANYETERSAEANACREYFDTAVEEVLQGFHWPFATKIAELGLIEENPNSEWGYSYQYPSDCLDIRRILSGTRDDSKDTEVKFKIYGNNTGKVIYTDKEDAEAEYTMSISDPARWPADFGMAVSFLLAAYIAARVTGGDPFKKGVQAFQMFQMKMPKVQARQSNEQKYEREPVSEFERVRG
jgi:hypothetical protein